MFQRVVRSRVFIRSFSGGPLGVEGRTPSINQAGGGVAITDPFILYQNYVRSGQLQPDEMQLRAMKQFQKLYQRLLNYRAPEEIQIRINLLLKKLELKYIRSDKPMDRMLHSVFSSMSPDADKRQLIKYMTDEDELTDFNAPQGLLINGEVGCGKSLLMDIFASSLPQESKMRWHFHNFMLWVYTEMHRLQQERNVRNVGAFTMENEFILFEIAQTMITKNTVLILDEFMLPDIASANIIKILFTFYFKLGGVLVATSNKLPEELYASEFHKSKFQSFVNILHLRCQSMDMKSEKDYRVMLSDTSLENLHVGFDNELVWNDMLQQVGGNQSGTPSSVTVYSRCINVPNTYLNNTVCKFDFADICRGQYSASDYISITSKYHTIIIDKIPIMTMSMKNEAKRLITLIDSIYESKCQLYIRSEVDLEYLFFPDVFHRDNPEIMKLIKVDATSDRLEVQDEEMYARTRIAMESPYRPNTATYDTVKTETYSEPVRDINYKNRSAFTGEDEQFAYKRAISRITEMVGSPYWKQVKWVPIDASMRPWETPQETETKIPANSFGKTSALVAPKFHSLNHFWAMGDWTTDQGKRLKDTIVRKWIRSSIRRENS